MTRRSELPRLYLAGPLFNDAERSYNLFLKHRLEEHCHVYLPQEDGFLMSDLIASGQSQEAASGAVFRADIKAIDRCDVLLALLDGRVVDEGAAFELGYAYSLGKTCIALQTDFRRLAPFGNNPMIAGALSQTFQTIDGLAAWIRQFSQRHVQS
jgi:nucleoside 2-deoxyribosyltransferase